MSLTVYSPAIIKAYLEALFRRVMLALSTVCEYKEAMHIGPLDGKQVLRVSVRCATNGVCDAIRIYHSGR